MIYTKEWAEKILELLPDWESIAVDSKGEVYLYKNAIDFLDEGCWNTVKDYTYLGTVDLNGMDWKDSLVVRQWKPKLGELYFYPNLSRICLYEQSFWKNDYIDEHRAKYNLVFKTPEEAIAKSKKSLGIKD